MIIFLDKCAKSISIIGITKIFISINFSFPLKLFRIEPCQFTLGAWYNYTILRIKCTYYLYLKIRDVIRF